MVTVAIVGILASIAYPSYRSYVLRTHRTDAVRALTQAAQILQRCYSQTYSFAGCGPIPATAPASTPSVNGDYALSSTLTAGPPQTFMLTAVPVGAQAVDTTCAQFSLNQTGQQLAKDSSNNDQSTTCWGSN